MNYTNLYGKNLTNLLCNKVIEEFNLIDANHKTNIYVINLGQFLVVKGTTSINNPLNYSNLFSTYVQENFDMTQNYNVIDLIEYNHNTIKNIIDMEFSTSINELSKETMSLSNQGYYHIKNESNFILHSNQRLFEELIAIPEFSNYEGLTQKDNSIYISDKIFGLDLSSEKIYHFYMKYISYSLFEKNLCTDINLKLFYVGNLDDLNHETIDFEVSSKSLIVSNEWIKSLILDIFDFNYVSIKKHLSLDGYNFSNEILSKDKCWKKRDKISEMILL